MNISPICFDFDVTEFPGEEGTCLLRYRTHLEILRVYLKTRAGLANIAVQDRQRSSEVWVVGGCSFDSLKNDRYETVMLIDLLFISNKLCEDGVQKKMSSLCMELMKLRNKRDAKEKVSCLALHGMITELFRNFSMKGLQQSHRSCSVSVLNSVVSSTFCSVEL